MSNDLQKIRFWLFISSLATYVASFVFLLRGYYQNVDHFTLIGVLLFIAATVFMIITFLYPLIYKVEIMIEKMDEEENKKK